MGVETINNAGLKIWEFRMAIFWFILFSVNALCTSILASLTGTNWGTLDSQSKFMIVIAVTANWTGTIMAFTSKQAARIKQTGELFPVDGGNTTFTTKTQATQVTQQTNEKTSIANPSGSTPP